MSFRCRWDAWRLLFAHDTIQAGADFVAEYCIHRAGLHHEVDFEGGFSQEQLCRTRVSPFFIDQPEALEAVRVIGLGENEFLECLLGRIQFAGVQEVESFIPPFDIIFFFKRANLWILFPELFDMVRYIHGRRSFMEKVLRDRRWIKFLEKADLDLAEEARAGGCAYCGEMVHRGDYGRKPPGMLEEWDKRYSFCCARDGCRKRKTPASVRFLGRKVYAGVVVVLLSAMMHGLKPERVNRLREKLGISVRTLNRWRDWWLRSFTGGGFWKTERARFMPILKEATLPLSLVEVFGATGWEGLVRLMKFLAPITVPARKGVVGM